MKTRPLRLASGTLGLIIALTFGVSAATASIAAPLPSVLPAAKYTDAFAKQTHDLMNAERAKAGVRQLVWNQRIADVSQDWANKLAVAMVSPSFDWTDIHRPDAGGSLIPPGATMYRENIGINSTPARIVNWWMNSSGHRAAMLDPRVTDAGLGYAIPKSGQYAGQHIVVSNLAGYASTPNPGMPAPTPTPGTMTAIAVKAAQMAGILGTAVTGEIYGLRNGGGYQCFQRGCINYSPATGAHVSMGGIRTVWASIGFEMGVLGYPTTDELGGLRNGGVQQLYQGGAIVWSPANGGYVSIGGIRALWATTGYESGRLGYPTSNEYATGSGGVAQNYQGGIIAWSPVSGTRVTYK